MKVWLSPVRMFVVLLLCLISSMVLSFILQDPFQGSVEALLEDEAIAASSSYCRGGWLGVDGVRMLYCEVTLPRQEGEKLSHLGRVVSTREQEVCDSNLRQRYRSELTSFEAWQRTRRGLAGANSLYNEELGKACIYFSIPYG